MASELVLSTINERRLGRLGAARSRRGGAGKLFQFAKWACAAGWRCASRRKRGGRGPTTWPASSTCWRGLCFRFAWVEAGRNSAHDDEAVARMARLRGQKAA